ncbi:MAG: SAM-dependent methyltransferase [Candidatus Woesearchaeota archaeon]|nr:SAM-dependent methyltransferase [Candidatus Woesearchaeota archaeon]
MVLVITKKIADTIAAAKEEITVSLDLGKSQTTIQISRTVVDIAGQKIPQNDFKNLKEHFLYALEDNQVKRIAFFSDETQTYYKLVPTTDWPTFTLSSTPMHRSTHISPKEDTKRKMKLIDPIKGIVLDTCGGAGYTAIWAARFADEVHTFEKDSNVLRLAEYNPYSQELFTNKKIQVHEEDISSGIRSFKNNFFQRIVHDPPTFTRAPELYHPLFYEQLYRVLVPHGILYHYAPMPDKTKGKQFYLSILNHLKEAGFRNVEYHEDASGIRAVK